MFEIKIEFMNMHMKLDRPWFYVSLATYISAVIKVYIKILLHCLLSLLIIMRSSDIRDISGHRDIDIQPVPSSINVKKKNQSPVNHLVD